MPDKDLVGLELIRRIDRALVVRDGDVNAKHLLHGRLQFIRGVKHSHRAIVLRIDDAENAHTVGGHKVQAAIVYRIPRGITARQKGQSQHKEAKNARHKAGHCAPSVYSFM